MMKSFLVPFLVYVLHASTGHAVEAPDGGAAASEQRNLKGTGVCADVPKTAFGTCNAFCNAKNCPALEPFYDRSCQNLFDIFQEKTSDIFDDNVGKFPPCTKLQQFVEATFTPGGTIEQADIIAQWDETQQARVTYELVHIPSGTLTLGGNVAGSLVESIECQGDGENGVITVSFVNEIDPAFVTNMFPLNTVLMVDADFFGPCDLGEYEALTGEPLDSGIAPIIDGHLQIESVVPEGATNVILQGTSKDVFSMFERASLSITPQESEDPANRRLQPSLNVKFFDNFIANVGGVLDLELTGEVIDFGLPVPVISIDWGIFDGLAVVIESDYGLSVSASVKLVAEGQGSVGVRFFNISVPPTIPLGPAFKVGRFKLGFWLQPEIRVELQGGLKGTVGGEASCELSTGLYRTKFEAYASILGGYTYEFTQSVLKPVGASCSWNDLTDVDEALIDAFVGVVPRVALKIGTSADVSLLVKAGAKVEFAHKTADEFPFPPFERGDSIFPRLIGPCDEKCHQREIDLSAQIKDLELRVTLNRGGTIEPSIGYKFENVDFSFLISKTCDEDFAFECPGIEEGAPCPVDGLECAAGLVCDIISEVCVEQALCGSGCPRGQICEVGFCVPSSLCPGGNSDCPQGQFCDSSSFPPVCELGVSCNISGDSACPQGQVCDPETGNCVPRPCTSDADCVDPIYRYCENCIPGHAGCTVGVCIAPRICTAQWDYERQLTCNIFNQCRCLTYVYFCSAQGNECVCDGDIEGRQVCLNFASYKACGRACSSSNDCDADERCITGTCCFRNGRGQCTKTCGNPITPDLLENRRQLFMETEEEWNESCANPELIVTYV